MPTGSAYLNNNDMCSPHPSTFMITQRHKFDEEQEKSWLETKLQGLMHLSIPRKGDHGGFDRFALPGGGEFDHKVV